MSDLSEQAYAAGWMEDLEFDLWGAVISGPRRYGHLTITNDHIETLKRLSKACGGWVYFDAATDETFIPLDEWHERYRAHQPNALAPPNSA